MKKIIGTLFILGLIFSFIPKVSNAWDSGCLPGDAFSRTTGMSCTSYNYNYNTGYNYGYNSNLPYGCRPGDVYSMYTGQYCGNTYGNTYTGTNFYGQTYYLGQTGSNILALQQMLHNAGFYNGAIDGVFGPITKNAWVQYQSVYPNNSNNGYPNYCQTYCNYGVQPVVTGVSGSQYLNVNQVGTWTVNAYSNNGGVLTYSVNWGDQNVYPYYSAQPTYLNTQQSATFTHTYYQSGLYNVVFTVTNSSGQSAQTTLSVNVSGSGYGYGAPSIYSLSPASGIVGTQVTIYGTGLGSYSCGPFSCINNYTGSTTVNFGGVSIPNVYSSNGTSLTFTVPSSLNSYCSPGLYCAQVYRPVTPGTYPVSVTNSNGTSNQLNFQVIGYTY